MPLKIQKIINMTMIVLSWATLPWLGLRSLKKFLPASLLIVLLEALNVQLGKGRKWWHLSYEGVGVH